MEVLVEPAVRDSDGVLVVDATRITVAELACGLAAPDAPSAILIGPPEVVQTLAACIAAPTRVVALPDPVAPWVVQGVIEVLQARRRALEDALAAQERMELELRHTQKMDAVGQLASGVAHEINTPVQFVGDSMYFLQGAFEDLLSVVALAQTHEDPDLAELVEEVDLEFLVEEIPRAFDRARGGLNRVSTIVQAMRHFAKADAVDAAPADLVQAIQSTLVVSSNELRYVADVETDLQPLPLVTCRMGDINQVVLNLLINAAHAIADSDRARGTIRVATRDHTTEVEIRVSDTGCGIPESVQTRVFEPFFTTKEVGRGTGQGLAIAHAIVVEKHGGSLHFETEVGVGTTFVIRLPVRSTP